MKIGLNVIRARTEDYLAIAAKADELGYDLLMASDHLACPPVLPQTYPYSEDGAPPFTPQAPWLDPILALTYIAAATKRIRLATGVYILPLRHPTHVAKAVATLDVLSRGRVIFGVGTGWMREEFEAAGQDYDSRGKRTMEMVEVMRRLWTEDVASFKGRFFTLGPITFEPKPFQKPHPPVHFGGETPVALRRAAQAGDGWMGMRHTPESAREAVAKLTALRREYGRDKEPFEVTVQCGLPPTADNLKRLREAGVDRASVSPWVRGASLSSAEMIAGMERFADDVMAKL